MKAVIHMVIVRDTLNTRHPPGGLGVLPVSGLDIIFFMHSCVGTQLMFL